VTVAFTGQQLLDDGGVLLGGEVLRTGPGAACWWCKRPIPARSKSGRSTRIDAKDCGKKCRQARHRMRRRLATDGPAGATVDASLNATVTDPSRRSRRRVAAVTLAERPISVAYADPPYIGKALQYYGDQPTYAGEVDHVKLIRELERDYPDGWALSCSVASLDQLLPLLPADWHLCPWVKQLHPPVDTYGLHTCWETLIVVRGRQVKPGKVDWLLAAPARGGHDKLSGRKPVAFVAFLFRALGLVTPDGRQAHPDDRLADLFPGTGIVSAAFEELQRVGTVDDVADDASPVDRAA
jgi:hypothetical protein